MLCWCSADGLRPAKKKVSEASCGLFPFQESLNNMDGTIQAVRTRSSLGRVAQESASNAVKVGLHGVLLKLSSGSFWNQGPCLCLKSKRCCSV